MKAEPTSGDTAVDWASIAAARHEVVTSSIAELRSILQKNDPLEVISKVAVFILVRHPDSPGYDTPMNNEVNLEYLLSLATSLPFPEAPELPSPDVIQRTIELLTDIHLHASAHFSLSARESSSGTRGAMEEVASSLRLNQMYVRGDGYWSHLRATAIDLLRPHDNRLMSALGFRSCDFFGLIERAESHFIEGFHREHKTMADPYLDLVRPWKKAITADSSLTEDEQRKFEEFLRDRSRDLLEKKARFDALGSPEIFTIEAISDEERAVLNRLSCRMGENSIFQGSNSNFEFWPLNVTLTDSKPILEHDGRYYVFHSPKILRGAYTLLSDLLEKADHRYWERRFLKARGDYLEKETAILLLQALPGATIVTSASYNLSETGQQTETDIVVAMDDFLLIVECKSSTLSAGARRGRVEKARTSLKRTIVGGLNQAERLVRELVKVGTLTLTPMKGGRELTLSADDFRWVIRVNVTLELMGSISTSLTTLADGGMIDSPSRCWSVALNDLRVIVHILDSPISFLHYLVRRLDVNDLGTVTARDELDYVMHYIRQGLFFREENQPGPNEEVMISGFTKDLDDYFHRLEGTRTSGKRPRVRWGKGTKRLIGLLLSQRPRHWLTACVELLELNSPDREALAAKISDHLKRLRDQSSAFAFSFVANFEARKGVAIATSTDPVSAEELIVGRMAHRCREEGLDEVVVILLGVPISLSKISILFTSPTSEISDRGTRLLSQLEFETTEYRKSTNADAKPRGLQGLLNSERLLSGRHSKPLPNLPQMNTRPFGHSKRQVSEIGLGCWQLGGADWGNLDDDRAFEILNTAADAGVTFLDTADVYGRGRSETLIGRFLKERGENFFVATKLGRMPDLYPDGYAEAGVRAATEASLKRLGVEALDLTQLHCVPPAVLERGEIFEWLRKLRDEGKIRDFGASVESMDEARTCLAQEGLCSLQIIFNVFRQSPAEIFDECLAKHVGVIVRLPLASGLLAGKMTKDQAFAASDHRNYNRDGQAFNVGETFSGLPFEKGVELADALRPWVPAGMLMADMAQRWILDHEAVSTVITGASRPDQARANAAVSSITPLPPDLHEQLAAFYRNKVDPHVRGPV